MTDFRIRFFPLPKSPPPGTTAEEGETFVCSVAGPFFMDLRASVKASGVDDTIARGAAFLILMLFKKDRSGGLEGGAVAFADATVDPEGLTFRFLRASVVADLEAALDIFKLYLPSSTNEFSDLRFGSSFFAEV